MRYPYSFWGEVGVAFAEYSASRSYLGLLCQILREVMFYNTLASNMRIRLSSGLTPIYKFGLPGLWVSCAIYSIVDYVRSWSDTTLPNTFVPILLLYLVGGAVFFWKFGPLKRVHLNTEFLYVSNYLREIRIPFTNVADIREANWLTNSPRRIVVTLKSSSTFGSRIQFAPAFFSTTRIVSELRDRLS